MGCGILGIYAPGEDVARLTYFGILTLQHRGQESAGIAVSDGGVISEYRDMGLVFQVFNEEILGGLQGNIAIGHNRYSTTGSSTPENCQPIVIDSAQGKSIALAHNGNLINAAKLKRQLIDDGFVFQGSSDSEIIARMIGRYLEEGAKLVDAITKAMAKIRGAYSLVILARTKLVAVRDPWGIRPLCLGRMNNGWVLSSETCALDNIGAQFEREIEPGEILVIDENGLESFQGAQQVCKALCVFEFIYFARPDSLLYGKCLYDCRKRMGIRLFEEHPCSADLVIPVPDTGIPAAIGYAEKSQIPYGDGFIKNRYIGRTFIDPDQRQREMGVRFKLSPLPSATEGRRVVAVEDSIVRGTTTKGIVALVRQSGRATQVHMRVSAPQYRYPCFYGIDTGTKEELIATEKDVEAVRQHIGSDSLGHLSIEGLLKAIGLSEDHFCLACFDGNYPIPVDESQMDKFALGRRR